MIRKAFKMKLFPNQQQEYQKRHDELWPEMQELLKAHGALDYVIFHDKETDILFGYLEIEDEAKWAAAAKTAINQKWWDYMADIMETNPDNSPVSTDLTEVFCLN